MKLHIVETEPDAPMPGFSEPLPATKLPHARAAAKKRKRDRLRQIVLPIVAAGLAVFWFGVGVAISMISRALQAGVSP